MLSLGVESLLRLDVKRPADHMALITIGNVSTLLICRQPLSEEDISRLRQVCEALQYQIVHVPDSLPTEPILRQILSAESSDQLAEASGSG